MNLRAATAAAPRPTALDLVSLPEASGIDSLVAAGRVDPDRLFYGSWSWGGYTTAWTMGHSGRFRAAVAGADVVDTVTRYSLSDINHGLGRLVRPPRRALTVTPRRRAPSCSRDRFRRSGRRS